MELHVSYFALLKEAAGIERETILWDGAPPTLAELKAELAKRRPELKPILANRPVLSAVNQEYAGDGTLLGEGDEIALFPPVSGG